MPEHLGAPGSAREGWLAYCSDLLKIAGEREYRDDVKMSLTVEVGDIRRLHALLERSRSEPHADDATAKSQAERLVVCQGFRWMPGMLGSRFGQVASEYSEIRITRDNAGVSTGAGGWLPDLRDPATRGCVLHLLREKYSRLVVVRWECSPDYWSVFTHHMPSSGKRVEHRIAEGGTEAEALVAAMEAPL